MRVVLFAVLLALSVTATAVPNSPIRLQVPEQCANEVQMASFVLEYFAKGVSKDEFNAFVSEMGKHPDADSSIVEYTFELIDLVYGFKPKNREQYMAVYKVVIQRCIYEKQPTRSAPGMPV